MGQRHIGGEFEQDHREMVIRPHAGAADENAPGIGLGEGHQIGKRF